MNLNVNFHWNESISFFSGMTSQWKSKNDPFQVDSWVFVCVWWGIFWVWQFYIPFITEMEMCSQAVSVCKCCTSTHIYFLCDPWSCLLSRSKSKQGTLVLQHTLLLKCPNGEIENIVLVSQKWNTYPRTRPNKKVWVTEFFNGTTIQSVCLAYKLLYTDRACWTCLHRCVT